MISVKLDLSNASDSEKEAFLTLPHVASAIDTLAHLSPNNVSLSLVENNEQAIKNYQRLDPQLKS